MTSEEKKSPLWIALLVVWFFTVLPCVGLGALLAISATTPSGHLAVWAVLLLWICFPWVYALDRRIAWSCRLALLIGLVFFGICLFLSPSRKEVEGGESRFRSLYSDPARYNRFSISQIIPEIDQQLMGTRLFPLIDPVFTQKQGRQLRNSILKIYKPMRNDPDFAKTGNAMGICYREIISGATTQSHHFEYLPVPARKTEKLPVLIFLHGSLGNFKGYQWLWKKFADQHGCAILSPSHGFGEWRTKEGAAVIQRTIASCSADSRFDPERIFISGLSNGGAGVTIALESHSEMLAGAIYISPVLDLKEVNKSTYQKGIQKMPLFLISGSKDQRTPKVLIQKSVETIQQSLSPIEGLPREFLFVDSEDHFLFFSQPDLVMKCLSSWWNRIAH